MQRVMLTAILLSASVLGQNAKQVPKQELPSVINICIAHCVVLTLENGHYVHSDPQNSSIYTVESFTRDSFVLHRTDRGSFPLTATLTGKPSPDGNSIPSGTILWTSGNSGQGAFKAAWGAAIKTVPASDAERDAALASKPPSVARPVVQPNAPNPRIAVPPGASPQFASLPADIRAVLRPEAAILPTKYKLACGDAAGDSNAEEALEIGKFAWRAAEFPRGYCWIKRSADLGNVRAKVLLGVSAGMGWGVPQSWTAAFQYFKAEADTTTDVWAAYFTGLCYENGVGTAVDKARAVRLDTWLTFRPEGQALFWSIGDDDAEMHREYERFLLILDPPTTGHSVCHVPQQATVEPCYIETEVDQERLQQQLAAVDRKYK